MINSFTENEELKEALKAFLDMRKSIKKPIQTEYAFKLALNKLKQLSDRDSERIEIVNQSVEHNWRTFYTLQNSYRTNTEVEMPDYMKQQEKGDIVSTPVSDEAFAWSKAINNEFNSAGLLEEATGNGALPCPLEYIGRCKPTFTKNKLQCSSCDIDTDWEFALSEMAKEKAGIK